MVVVDISTGIAGPYCARLLADFGARVVKVEPPGGDSSRELGPFVDGVVDPERSATFLHVNRGKQGVVLDLHQPDALGVIDRLIAGADVLIASQRSEELTALGLAPSRLLKLRPALVITLVTPFGDSGPYSGYQASEVVLSAMGGPMSSRGLAERPPIKLAGTVVEHQGGNTACTATLAAYLHALETGDGQVVDVANLETQEGSIDNRLSFLLGYQYTGLSATRSPGHEAAVSPALPGGFHPAADGKLVQIATLGNHIPKMLATLGDPDLATAVRAKGGIFKPEVRARLDAAIAEWLASRTARQAMRDAQVHGWPVIEVNTASSFLADEHAHARGFWEDVEHPAAGTVRLPGKPWRFDDEVVVDARMPAPTLGQHTTEVLASIGMSSTEIDDLFDSEVAG